MRTTTVSISEALREMPKPVRFLLGLLACSYIAYAIPALVGKALGQFRGDLGVQTTLVSVFVIFVPTTIGYMFRRPMLVAWMAAAISFAIYAIIGFLTRTVDDLAVMVLVLIAGPSTFPIAAWTMLRYCRLADIERKPTNATRAQT